MAIPQLDPCHFDRTLVMCRHLGHKVAVYVATAGLVHRGHHLIHGLTVVGLRRGGAAIRFGPGNGKREHQKGDCQQRVFD